MIVNHTGLMDVNHERVDYLNNVVYYLAVESKTDFIDANVVTASVVCVPKELL